MTSGASATWLIQALSLSKTMSLMSSVRLFNNVSNQIQGTDQQWRRSPPNWRKWFLSRLIKQPQDFLPFGGLSLRYYLWRQLKALWLLSSRNQVSLILLCENTKVSFSVGATPKSSNTTNLWLSHPFGF